jgi:hypothetical protein
VRPEQVQTDGSVIIDDKVYPLGSTLWEIDGHGFVPIDVIIGMRDCEVCEGDTIRLICKDDRELIVCKECNILKLYGDDVNE